MTQTIARIAFHRSRVRTLGQHVILPCASEAPASQCGSPASLSAPTVRSQFLRIPCWLLYDIKKVFLTISNSFLRQHYFYFYIINDVFFALIRFGSRGDLKMFFCIEFNIASKVFSHEIKLDFGCVGMFNNHHFKTMQ